MAKDPAFLFYTGDFTTGTQFFTDEQVGVYIRLLMAQHQHGHLSEKQVNIICRTHDKEVLSKFTKDEQGLYFNERLDIEISKRKTYSESRSNNRKGNSSKEIQNISLNNISSSYVNHMENENKNKDIVNNKPKKEKKSKVVIIPSLIEFCDYVKLQIPNEYSQIEKSLKLKYEAWKINEWKDGYNTPIVNWKAKVLNTIQHLKKENSNGITNPNDRKIGRNTESEIKAFIEHGADLDAKMEFNRQNDFKS